MNPTPSFVIVGAGFSGIAVAVQLLRALQQPATVHLVNRNHRFGRGLAYGTRSGSHLLNVPAGRMSLSPGDDEEFVRFLRDSGLAYKGSDFVPRKLYGDYLEAMLERAQAMAAPGVTLDLVQGEVDSLEESASHVDVRLQDGRALRATEVILALGNFAPKPPCGDAASWSTGAMANDPWGAAVIDRLPRDADVLLAGSGLTAFDVVLTLLDRGHTGKITMLSRRGLLPQSHREQETPPAAGLVPSDVMRSANSARSMLRETRKLIDAARLAGHDWRDVIGGLRSHTPRLWQQLDAGGRRQFMRHVLPYWDTHRHRAAPAIHGRIREALASGQLRVVAGRLASAVAQPQGGVHVEWVPRGSSARQVNDFDAVVNCTGPSSDLRRVRDGLIRRMCDGGRMRIDACALGLDVDAGYRILRDDGRACERVRYVGPLLKAQYWEATAVPELRVHAQELAARLEREAREGHPTMERRESCTST